MLKVHELKLYYKYVHMTLPVYLSNLPFIFETFTIIKHGYTAIFIKEIMLIIYLPRIGYDISLLINCTAVHIRNNVTIYSLQMFINYAILFLPSVVDALVVSNKVPDTIQHNVECVVSLQSLVSATHYCSVTIATVSRLSHTLL